MMEMSTIFHEVDFSNLLAIPIVTSLGSYFFGWWDQLEEAILTCLEIWVGCLGVK